jgi:hypothetical protein
MRAAPTSEWGQFQTLAGQQIFQPRRGDKSTSESNGLLKLTLLGLVHTKRHRVHGLAGVTHECKAL